MADADAVDVAAGAGTEEPQPEAKPSPAKKKKKKKSRKLPFFILLLLIGVGAGLQASGGYDLRPAVYTIVPKLPVVGPQLTELLNVPAVYSLTADERRQLELDEWERALADRKRSLDEQDEALRSRSNDLSVRDGKLIEAEAEVAAKIEELNNSAKQRKGGSGGGGGGGDDADVEDTVRTVSEMSPKNAAAIIERLRPELAVKILDGLDNQFRARTLAKMEAPVAADLMERLTEMQAEREE